MALGHASFIARLVVGLGQGWGLYFGSSLLCGIGLLGLVASAWNKAHGLVFADQQAIDLGRQLIGKVQQPGGGGLGQAQQPVARGQVQQRLAAFRAGG